MKKRKKLFTGGIRSKVFRLILFTVILLTAAGLVVSLNQNHMLSEVVRDSTQRQKEETAAITTTVMDLSVGQALYRSGKGEAMITEGMFKEVGNRIAFLADYTARMLATPEQHPARPFAEPDMAREGEWSLKVVYADNAVRTDPALSARVGMMAGLEDTMISLCSSTGISDVYVSLPEGVHLSVSQSSASWFADGSVRSYDPRTRPWYRKAEQEGRLIFTEGERDATTGAYCIECAAPVYGPDGNLCAVVGADMYLDEIERIMHVSQIEGEYQLLINQSGHAVLSPQEEVFPMAEAEKGSDLRNSGNALFRQVISEALQGGDPGVLQMPLQDGTYYVTAMPIRTTGWILLSAYSKETAGRFAAALQQLNETIQAESAEQYRVKKEQFRISTIVLLILIAAVMIALSLQQGGRIVKPLNAITKRISELKGGTQEFVMEDAYRTGDEVEELAQSFADLSHKTVEYVDTVRIVTAEKERIGTELALGTEIQASMLPHKVPAFPDRKDFDIMGSMDPAKEVGGDFYDYFLIDPDHLGIVIADVSGKGVPAALFMMASKIILQSVAMLGKSPAEILAKTNEAICSSNEAQMFVTVWMGILELSTGRLTAANAGHEYPVLKSPDGSFELYKDKHGFVLGGMEGIQFREYEIRLAPGSRLFLYTDGLPEAANAENEMFGTGRMLAALNSCSEETPEEIMKNVRKAVDGFVKDAEQFDDLTMLCLIYKGPGAC